uniref:Retrovirus-related Pol polyprotein from transposon TNT 1-94-like beta-barrel domain-containing protein n=1 Tax=Fagus sylvatica TaxID=28930 RepID=A0A2N9I8X4_FAGSY
MTGEDGKTSGIEKFDGTNFGYWNMQIEDYLYSCAQCCEGDDTVGMMTTLSGMYEKPSANNKVHLMKKLFNLKMAKGAAVAKHLNEFNTITNQLFSVEIEFDDEIRALIVLASLPNSWEAIRMAERCNIDNAEGQAFVTENTGHIRMNCRHWRKEQIGDKDQKHDDEKDTTTVLDDEEVVVLSVQEQKCEHVDNNNNDWVVDLAATHHVVRTKELFTTYKTINFGTVKMGNTSYSKIVGIGDVCIKTNVGFTVILKNVQDVLDLCFNLISTLVMDQAVYCNHLGNGKWKLTKGPMVVARERICCDFVQDSYEGL